jgi:hypothetical protein
MRAIPAKRALIDAEMHARLGAGLSDAFPASNPVSHAQPAPIKQDDGRDRSLVPEDKPDDEPEATSLFKQDQGGLCNSDARALTCNSFAEPSWTDRQLK